MSESIRSQIRAALAAPPAEVKRLHEGHINPTLIEALGLLGYGRDFVRAQGSLLWDDQGEEYLDFLAGYGSVPLGHNHPEVIAAVEEALKSASPNFLQIAPQPLSLAEVRVGDVTVYNVDAVVVPAGMDMILLGNSFLTRFQMKRDADVLVLDKRP